MRGAESLGHPDRDVERLLDRDRAVAEERRQGPARHVLHHDEPRALVDATVEDRDDVAVAERGGRPRLPLESLDEHPVLDELRGEHLDRDLAAERAVPAREDAAHPASPEQRVDLVAPVQDVTRLQHVQVCPLPTEAFH